MDNQKSPKDVVDSNNTPASSSPSPRRDSHSPEMAAAVANLPQPLFQPTSSPTTASQPIPAGTKRYRPAPAKTFQCRGYGECRMVFSRSEHLLRHIRYAPVSLPASPSSPALRGPPAECTPPKNNPHLLRAL
ncbi:hypothetical protein PsYK624_162900 [Phanerochaete sordida]|uniref:C2H2-type domain-containing protein n=1 Tax=Phanerochaete sordida TaxID=48140 RepID=A0A9P3GR71_9APHY|nr:hypothetical protein PsYK624_162900 [Phanerochaete sordida]